jgi:hypothetical protein
MKNVYKSKCRNCHQPRSYHYTNGGCDIQNNSPYMQIPISLYEPSDNLEYLELKYEKQNPN